MDKNPASYIEKLLSIPEPFSLWSSFWKVCVYLFFIITFLDILGADLFNKIFQPSIEYRIPIFIGTYLIPYGIYILFFIINRSYPLKIAFSGKTNLVIAYNTEVIHSKKFPERYKKFLASLRNEIGLHNLGDKIKIIACPTDIKIDSDNVAEAKTKIGLRGATIVIWGDIQKSRGKYKFRTKYSYEFSYPRNVKTDREREAFKDQISHVIGKGVLPNFDVQIEDFAEDLAVVVLFILGITTFTMGIWDKTETFLNSFKEIFNELDILKKRDLSKALMEVNEILIRTHLMSITTAIENIDKTKNYELVRVPAEKILQINRSHYEAHLALAFYHENTNDRQLAIEHTKYAESNSKKKQHDYVFNYAYFALKDKDYKSMLEIYESMPDKINVKVLDICQDLNRLYEKTKDDGTIFAQGYLYFKWIDEDEGKKILRDFLGGTCSGDKDILIEKAKVIVS